MDFTDLGLDIFAGTIFGSLGATLELTAATLASASMPALFTAGTIPLYAGITGLTLFAGAVFTKLGSKIYKAASQ